MRYVHEVRERYEGPRGGGREQRDERVWAECDWHGAGQAEVKYKQRNLDNSQSTLERLQQEQEMRDMELQKINNLDQKISVELESLAARRDEYTEALKTFNNVGQLKQTAEENRTRMQLRKQRLDARRKALKQQVQTLTTVYDREKQVHTSLPQPPFPTMHSLPLPAPPPFTPTPPHASLPAFLALL